MLKFVVKPNNAKNTEKVTDNIWSYMNAWKIHSLYVFLQLLRCEDFKKK